MDLEKGNRLFTKDGRKVGNGIVSEVEADEFGVVVYQVITDFGNTMSLTAGELNNLYWLTNDNDFSDPYKNDIMEWLGDKVRKVLSI